MLVTIHRKHSSLKSLSADTFGTKLKHQDHLCIHDSLSLKYNNHRLIDDLLTSETKKMRDLIEYLDKFTTDHTTLKMIKYMMISNNIHHSHLDACTCK